MIRPLTGDDLNVPRIPEAEVLEWCEDGRRVVFSFAQQGQAMTLHFACEKSALRMVATAIDDMCDWLFWAYSWCRMIFGMIGRKSIEKVVKRCGFSYLTEADDLRIYVRLRR